MSMDRVSVLVVDDEPGIALLCKRLLTRAGFEATELTDPRLAVTYLQEHSVDLLLVDIRMPEVDGFEVITHARRLQPGIAILVMTGYGTVETAIRALRQGVDGLLLKPFDRGNELIEAVRQALADNQQKRDAARIQALRPLFTITESLLSETQRERLLELITSAICGYLRCLHAGYYQAEKGAALELQATRGRAFSGQFDLILVDVDASSAPLLVQASGPRDTKFREELPGMQLGSAMFVPVTRPNFRILLYAARDAHEPTFQESDFEMFQILARQAAVALENSRLYAEQLEYVRKVEDSQKALLQVEKMATAGRLSASIAHEVNNPLQAVQNCLHLAGREDLPAEKRKEYFDLARVELERLMLTVQRMLDFYRPGTPPAAQVDLEEILGHVIHLMSKQLSERGVLVDLDIPPSLPTVLAVDSQIQQVFINLALNAFDAMPEGGTLHITVRDQRDGIEIFFRDSGSGIPPERQGNIFEPFYSSKDAGTGLGLTVSYNIMTAHGGQLELVSDEGPGACFRVFLPKGAKS
jgi:signal transduction histidine kinase/CheY-like chemotaxis protein